MKNGTKLQNRIRMRTEDLDGIKNREENEEEERREERREEKKERSQDGTRLFIKYKTSFI